MLASKNRDVSDLFLSLVTGRPVFNVNIPVLQEGAGSVRYILHFGQQVDELVPILQSESLGSAWRATLIDRKGIVIARSTDHQRYVGQPYPLFSEIKGAV